MNRKGSRPTFESNPDESIWDKQKRCIDTNGELVAELEAHSKPNEVRELLAGLMVFNFKLRQFDKFLEDLKASSGGGQAQTFTNPGKLSACYDKVLAKLGEILFTFRDQKKKNRLKRLFGSVNLRKEFDQTHALLQQYSRELLELHLKEIEAEKDRQALLNKQQTIPVPPRPGTKPAPATSSPTTGRPGPVRPPPRPTKPHPGAAKTLPAPIQPEKPPTPHSSPTTMRPAPSAKPAVKIGQRGTLVLKSAPLAARIDIEKMFWSQFKMGFQVPWDDFERRFIKLLSMPSLPAADSKLMRHILDSSATGFITFPKYDEFVKGFGPLKLCLRNIKRLFSRDWWHGFLSGEETDYLLEGSPPGSFLGRMSISNPGSFALAVVNKDNTVKHFLVKSVTNQDGLDFGRGVYLPLKGERSVAFPDLVSLVESKDYSRVFQTPLSCDFIKESFFHGVLDREEAEELLKRKPVGTFLVRFSSTQKPHLAVSWIAEGNVITHRLFERKGGKYWNGPSGFATLKETVASCPELKVACENTRAEMYAIMQEVPLSEIPSVAPSPGVEIDSSKGKQQPSKPVIETSTNYGDFSDMDLAMASAGATKAGGATRDNQYISFGGIGGEEGEKETEGSRYVEEDIYSLAGGGGGGGGSGGGGGGGDAYGMYDEEGSGQNEEEEDEDEEGLFSIMEALKARAETKKK